MSYYIKSQVVKITGLSSRQVQFYTEEGYLELVSKSKPGRGHRRRYTKQNLVELLILKELASFGITRPKMMRMLNLAKNHPYVRMYSNSDLCKKDIRLFLYFHTNHNGAIKIDYIIPGVMNELIIPRKECEDHQSSYLLINFTEILNKIN